MGKLLNSLFGMLMPDATSQRDQPAAAQPARLIEGARNARELCMLPVDHMGPELAAELHRGQAILPDEAEHGRRRIVQLKADGIRALYLDGRIVTRNGTPLHCALHCQPGLARMEERAGLGSLVFDGEYVAEGGFNATLAEQAAGKGQGVFWAFDVLPLQDWRQGSSPSPIEVRLANLRRMVLEQGDSLFVGMLDSWLLDPVDTLAKVREIWAAGYEGVVTKRPGSPYVRGRSEHWQRIKETHTVDGVIADLMGRPDGTLKKMVVLVEDRCSPKPRQIIVGTGWSEEEGRLLLRNHAAAGIGAHVEISFQQSTGETRSVRGARFHRIRDRKEPRT